MALYISRLFNEAVQPRKVKGNPAASALESVQLAIEQMEQQKHRLEEDLENAQREIDSVKSFREQHVKKVSTWKIQDECRELLRRENPDVQVAVAPWEEYKAALGEILFRNVSKPHQTLRVYFLEPEPEDANKVKKIVTAYGKYNVEVYGLTGTYPDMKASLYR